MKNLSNYATKELSQDAFLRWLFESLREPERDALVKNVKTFIIKYYLTKTAYRGGVPAFTETFRGDRNTAVYWAQRKVRRHNFKFYDIQEK
jgi:hypothetical protein